MRPKPVVPRALACQDVDDVIAYYLSEGSDHAALGFINALEHAYRHIARHPATGSPRWAQELDMPGLRAWRLRHYPYVVFYMDGPQHVDVWRVLHGQRDLPAWLELHDVMP